MNVSLATIVRKNRQGPGTALAGTTYPALVELVARMQAQDQRIIFDSLRPVGDEFWNMIDGQKSVEDIAQAVCLEFGFDLSAELFIPLVDGMVKSDAVSVVGHDASAQSGGKGGS